MAFFPSAFTLIASGGRACPELESGKIITVRRALLIGEAPISTQGRCLRLSEPMVGSRLTQ